MGESVERLSHTAETRWAERRRAERAVRALYIGPLVVNTRRRHRETLRLAKEGAVRSAIAAERARPENLTPQQWLRKQRERDTDG
jgi:hypothetical protein